MCVYVLAKYRGPAKDRKTIGHDSNGHSPSLSLSLSLSLSPSLSLCLPLPLSLSVSLSRSGPFRKITATLGSNISKCSENVLMHRGHFLAGFPAMFVGPVLAMPSLITICSRMPTVVLPYQICYHWMYLVSEQKCPMIGLLVINGILMVC